MNWIFVPPRVTDKERVKLMEWHIKKLLKFGSEKSAEVHYYDVPKKSQRHVWVLEDEDYLTEPK